MHALSNDTPANRLGIYILAAFVACLPFDRLYSELALGLFALHTLIHLHRSNLLRLRQKSWLLPASLYFLTVAGTCYSAFRAEAFYEWERQLALVLLPLLFVLTNINLYIYRLFLLKTLMVSCSLTILYLYYVAFKVIAYNHLPVRALFTTAFINHNFSEPIDMHATYFSMYIALASVTAIYLWKHAGSRFKRIAAIAVLLILVAGLFQLASRAVLIALLVIVNVIVPFMLFAGKARVRYLLFSLSLSVLFILLLVQNNVFKNRYVTELKNDLTQQSINLNILEPRAVRWACGIELIKHAPLTGYGSGSEVALLKQQYFARKYYNSYINDLNIHNQFLSMQLKFGLTGLLVLLTVLVAGFRYAWRNNDLFFASFLVIVTIVFFSENVLDGNKGIFFFGFFYAAFYLARKHISKTEASAGGKYSNEDKVIAISA